MSRSWDERIAELVVVKRQLSLADKEELWPQHAPNPSATEAEIRHTETVLGEPLDPRYRDFLLHAGGWRNFLHCVDLFGPSDLIGGPLHECASSLLSWLQRDGVLRIEGLERDHVFPIAVTLEDMDLFVMGRRDSPIPGVVVWFAGYPIERYPDFEAYFDAMVGYNRRDVEDLEEGTGE